MVQSIIGQYAVRRFHAALGAQIQQQHHSTHGHQPFRPLPAPTGLPPYRLALADVVTPPILQQIADSGRLVFHAVGDTGGIKTPVPQLNVARQMVKDAARADNGSNPALFYHLGDVVYFFGESKEYYPQFYEPYEPYPGPIFAIPGNHDGDLSADMETAHTPSLAAFVDNFCQHIPHHTRDALDAPRSGMNQPNVYWTLTTPLATIIGLYTNVPEGGRLDDDQIAWFARELTEAPAGLAVIVAMHHPIYSGDDHHSGSAYMGHILDDAIAKSGRVPTAVLCGHVHNYQRFTREIQGKQVPYIVAGAGGYHNLHHIVQPLRSPETAAALPDAVSFDTFCDDKFGFLRLAITADAFTGEYFTVEGFGDPASGQATSFDTFTYPLR